MSGTGRRAGDTNADDTWALMPKNSKSNGKYTEQTYYCTSTPQTLAEHLPRAIEDRAGS